MSIIEKCCPGLMKIMQAEPSKLQVSMEIWKSIWIPLFISLIIFPLVYLIYGMFFINWRNKKTSENFVILLFISFSLSILIFFAFPYIMSMVI